MARRNRDLVQILDEHERAIRRLKQSLARVSGAGGGVTDHGALTGLADNDHPQYALLTGGADAIFTGAVEINNGADASLKLEGTIAGQWWAGSVEFPNTDGTTTWRFGVRGDVDTGDGGNLYFEYYTGSAWENWMSFDIASDYIEGLFPLKMKSDSGLGQLRINKANTATKATILYNDGTSFYFLISDTEDGGWNSKRPFRIELSSGQVYLGETAYAEHFYPVTDDTYDLGSAAYGWRQLFMGPGAPIYLNGSTAAVLTHDGSNMILYNDHAGHFYIDARVDNSDINLRATNGTTLRNRIHIDGNGYINFYNKSAAIRWEVGDSHVKFYDELYGTSAMTSTGSTAYNEIVHNAGTYQFYRFTSRRDVKKNIKDMDPVLSEGIYDLILRTFDMRKANQTGDVWADYGQHGMIADEVHKVYGDIAAPPAEDGEPSGWSAKFMVVMLLSEAQKSKRHAIAQDARISSLEAALHRLNK